MTRNLKFFFGVISAFYVLALIYILFFRGRGNVYMQQMPLSEYMTYAVNLVPFETIKGFWNALKNHTINTDIAVFNIFGNIALFVPFGFLLPVAAKRLRALWKCAAVTFFAVLTAEILQLLLKVGSFDIDDIILNMLGAVTGYAVFRIAFIVYKKTLKPRNVK